ncbi:GNAT family N-acetyltransferase [Microlunatus parietis]|uniref:GNAT superfamily N-acetyltransferase n=1 Tax=Microlunatus parietis TaxID=682979 RepID=A0A7Y9I575_9ACTN|nr:GNAT family N-acetyltransferase [Microlunatus parietis]NYE70328.1 GNAT superfamily N-acetyltransferase [Microlunatus parietis]
MATSELHDSAVRVLSAAFLDDPVLSWAFPDRQTRPTALNLVLAAFLRNGRLRTIEDGDRLRAVAVWCSPAEHEVPAPDQPDPVLIPHLGRLAELGRLLDDRYPGDADHRYLRVIGVGPKDRGRGYGGALLAEGLAECDAAGLPAYLEASAPRNAALYARHGFRPYGPPIQLPDGPELFPLWREPAPKITNRTESRP